MVGCSEVLVWGREAWLQCGLQSEWKRRGERQRQSRAGPAGEGAGPEGGTAAGPGGRAESEPESRGAGGGTQWSRLGSAVTHTAAPSPRRNRQRAGPVASLFHTV